MVAFNFKKSYSDSIISGEKYSTIRPTRRCKPGDKLQLYTGLRTRHAKLLKVAECISVDKVIISQDGIEGIEMELEEFLIMQGFEGRDYSEFAAFLSKNYTLPCTGYLVIWD